MVVVINNLLAGQQLKHMATVTSDNFNKTGRALAIVLDSIRGIEGALGKHGVEIAEPVDSKGGQDLWSASAALSRTGSGGGQTN